VSVATARAGAFVGLLGLAAIAVLIAAMSTGTGSGGPLGASVEGLSSSASSLLDRVATLLPLGFAFGAGMVSAVNPCGFAMLPAYLALFLSGTSDRIETRLERFRQALVVSSTVTAGFVLLFALVGLAVAGGARSLGESFPWLGLAAGALLIVAGAWLAVGGTLHANFAERLSSPLASAPTTGAARYFTFGLAYGLASLSCTLPVFLAVLGSSLTLSDFPAMVLQLVLYGLGMGVVIALLTLSIALFQGALVKRLRRAVRYMAPVSALLLLLAGSYIVYYWLTVGGLLDVLASGIPVGTG
jgi:cytochrome c-type biogenesis protein